MVHQLLTINIVIGSCLLPLSIALIINAQALHAFERKQSKSTGKPKTITATASRRVLVFRFASALLAVLGTSVAVVAVNASADYCDPIMRAATESWVICKFTVYGVLGCLFCCLFCCFLLSFCCVDVLL